MAKKYVLSGNHFSTRLHEIETGVFVPEIVAFTEPLSSQEGGANLIYKYLRNAGSVEMAVDGDDPVIKFDFVSVGESNIGHINFEILDGTMRNERFAGLAAALTNGILMEVFDTDGTTVLLDFLDGVPIKSNANWTSLTGRDEIQQESAGDDLLPIHFDLIDTGELLNLQDGQIIRVTIQDDLSTLTQFRALVQGHIE